MKRIPRASSRKLVKPQAIQTPFTLGSPVPPRELEVLCLLAHGLTSREITHELQISVSYYYVLIKYLKCRFGVETPAGIVSAALSQGIVSLDQEC